MGRPLPQKFFGNTSQDGPQIQVQANLGSGTVTAYIIRQIGTRKYIATNGSATRTVTLKNAIAAPGDATLTATDAASATYKVKTLTRHRLKTFDNHNYAWKTGSATATAVSIPTA